jgi:hypothetical protein
MDESLLTAANLLGIPTHASAGPGHGPAGRHIWARWPRSTMDIAHDALEAVIERDRTAGVAPCGRSHLWRAYSRGWSYEGKFVDAVARLALHVSASPWRSESATRGAHPRCSPSH